MNLSLRKITTLALLLVIWGFCTSIAIADDVPRMSKEELKGMLDEPDVVILDVRKVSHWNRSDSKIQGAIREDLTDLDSFKKEYPDNKTYVLYCA